MSLTRRNFLVCGSASVAAGTVAPLLLSSQQAQLDLPNHYDDWKAVRREFDLAPDYIHLGLFYITSHPRPVSEAIEQYRRHLDANPFLTTETALFESAEQNIFKKTSEVIAKYINADAEDIALTQNTTTGLSLIYHGLPLREGDEILTTTHDHFVHHESIRLATGRCGAAWRKISLFDSFNTISPDEIAERIRRAIGPRTRAVGLTWVHSSSGVRIPVRRIADMMADVNRKREEKDRVLLIVDGVHGLGVEDPNITALGCDAFSAGTHKWIFGPRGTGFVWAKPSVWANMHPVIPTLHSLQPFEAWAEEREPTPPARAAWFSPGGFQAFEHFWALPAAFDFHQKIGTARITRLIHELNRQLKEGLVRMPHVELHTPLDENFSGGMVCFEVKGLKPAQVVQHLLRHKIVASTTPYRVTYARIACGIVNTPEEVEKTLEIISQCV